MLGAVHADISGIQMLGCLKRADTGYGVGRRELMMCAGRTEWVQDVGQGRPKQTEAVCCFPSSLQLSEASQSWAFHPTASSSC